MALNPLTNVLKERVKKRGILGTSADFSKVVAAGVAGATQDIGRVGVDIGRNIAAIGSKALFGESAPKIRTGFTEPGPALGPELLRDKKRITTTTPAPINRLPLSGPRQISALENRVSGTSLTAPGIPATPALAPKTGFQTVLDPSDPAAIGGAADIARRQAEAARVSAATTAPLTDQLITSQKEKEKERDSANLKLRDLEERIVKLTEGEADAETEEQLAQAEASIRDIAARAGITLSEIRNQPIVAGILRGQEAAFARQAEGQLGIAEAGAETLRDQLARAQAKRKGQLAGAEKELEFEKARQPGTREGVILKAGESLVDPVTGETITERDAAAGKPVTLSAGQTLVDPETGEEIFVAAPKNANEAARLLTPKEQQLYNVPAGTTYGEVFGIIPGATQKDIAMMGRVYKANNVVNKVLEAIDLIPATSILGPLGRVAASKIPGTASFKMQTIIDTIVANLGFDELQAMRDASPTGGALGQVSEREINFLQSTLESLNIGLDNKTLEENFRGIQTHYNNWLAAVQEAGGFNLEGGGGGDGEIMVLPDGTQLQDDGTGNFVEIPKADGGGTALQNLSIGGRNVQVNQSIASNLEKAAAAFKEATGKELQINQSFRTAEQQQAIFDRLSKTGGRVAPPGTSFHEKGLAIDVTNWEEAAPFLNRFGFRNDLAGDKGHFSVGETSGPVA